MGNKKAGYVRDETGNLVQGQDLGGGPFFEPFPVARALDADAERRRREAEEYRRAMELHAQMQQNVLQRVDVLRTNR